MNRAPALRHRAGRASPRAGARLGHTATIADAALSDPTLWRGYEEWLDERERDERAR
jgi:hypothetical protein